MDKDELLVKLGERIKQLRQEKKISQTELANRIGKDQPSLNRLELGNINPSYIYLWEVAQGLEMKINEVLEF